VLRAAERTGSGLMVPLLLQLELPQLMLVRLQLLRHVLHHAKPVCGRCGTGGQSVEAFGQSNTTTTAGILATPFHAQECPAPHNPAARLCWALLKP
jgi:hypothetical protein